MISFITTALLLRTIRRRQAGAARVRFSNTADYHSRGNLFSMWRHEQRPQEPVSAAIEWDFISLYHQR